MSYRFERDEDVGEAVRRIAAQQVGTARKVLQDPGEVGIEEAVHDCRKRCKKLRGLVRLVRPALGDEYQRANVAFRDAASELAPFRDAHALLGTFDDLLVASTGRTDAGALGPVRDGLAGAAGRASHQAGEDSDRIGRALELLSGAEARIGSWPLDDTPWEAVAGGLAKTYGRGRSALADVRREPTPERFHEWRKRAKYTWYHTRLLRPAAPSVLGPAAEAFSTLADTLGDAHDLVVLTATLRGDPDRYGGADVVDATCIVADGLRVQLERRAVSSGLRLYVEPADAFAARLGAYWRVWQEVGDELPGGELSDLFPATGDGRPLAVAGVEVGDQVAGST